MTTKTIVTDKLIITEHIDLDMYYQRAKKQYLKLIKKHYRTEADRIIFIKFPELTLNQRVCLGLIKIV